MALLRSLSKGHWGDGGERGKGGSPLKGVLSVGPQPTHLAPPRGANSAGDSLSRSPPLSPSQGGSPAQLVASHAGSPSSVRGPSALLLPSWCLSSQETPPAAPSSGEKPGEWLPQRGRGESEAGSQSVGGLSFPPSLKGPHRPFLSLRGYS